MRYLALGHSLFRAVSLPKPCRSQHPSPARRQHVRQLTPKAAPNAAPSAMPSPVVFGLFVIRFPFLPTASHSFRSRGGRGARPSGKTRPVMLSARRGFTPCRRAGVPCLTISEWHAGQCFEERRHLRRHLGDVPGDLVHPRRITVASRHDRDLVDVCQRRWPAPSRSPACP